MKQNLIKSAAGLAGDPALKAAFVPLPARSVADNLPSPFYIAHRGASLIAPEDSLTAYRLAVAGGADGIETDGRTLADGSVGIMHDDTVDRTTLGTGLVADFTATTWRKLTIDSTGLMGTTGWPVESPPMMPDMLREFGNQTVIMFQGYDSGVLSRLNDACERRGINKRSIIYETNQADTATAAAMGFPVILISGVLPTNLAAQAAAGVTYIGTPETLITQQFVTDCHAVGIGVVPYSVNHHLRRDQLLALGVDGLISDDAVYLAEKMPYRKSDLFATQEVSVGHHRLSGSGISFQSPNLLRFTAASVGAIKLGYMKPDDPSNFVLDYQVNLAVSGAFSFMWVGKSDYWTTPTPAMPGLDGYLFTVLGTGQLRLEHVKDGVRTSFLAFGTAITSFALNTWLKVRLTVTPTTIAYTFPDTGQTLSFTHSLTRPLGRLVVGASTGQVDYRSIVLA